MLDVMLDVVLDTLKILPFLFAAYLVMEYLEQKMSDRAAHLLAQTDQLGPMLGAAVGIVPQCGFSATAAGFYAGGLISAGTLLAVFLSTSDEMLPVLLASAVPVRTIFRILGWKVVIAVATGFLADRIFRRKKAREEDRVRIHELCHEAGCNCGSTGGILRPALTHTAKTIWFIFLFSLLAGMLFHFVGEDTIAQILAGSPILSVVLSAIIGLIPNCAASVLITSLYVDGVLPGGAMMAGLLVSAGVGLLVLIRTNRRAGENLRIIGMLLLSGIFWGLILTLLKITF